MIETITGVELPVCERLMIRKQRLGTGKGKRISIVTGVHGDELEGQLTAYELARRIQSEPENLEGTVDIYPAMNPLGIDTIMRGLPGFDLDMNRIFPGSEDGDMNEHIADEILADLQGSDLVVDIHASNIFLTELPQIRINELHEKQLLPYAASMNVDFIWVHQNSTVLESTLAYSLNSRNTPTLVVEMGVGMRITKEYGVQLADGILHTMRRMGIWKGEDCEVKKPLVCNQPDGVDFLNAPVSGIFIKEREVGSRVQAGMRLGTLVDPLEGKKLCEVKAEHDGLLFTTREYPVVQVGSLMGRILRQ
jgi:uncharacterized protein